MPTKPSSLLPESPMIDSRLRRFLARTQFANSASEIRVTALAGGVSCDVWKVKTGGRTFVVKRALQRLRVAKVWEAPVTRSEAEGNWLNFAASVAPGAVPQTLAHDPEAGMIALEYLDPEQYPVWKQLLFEGVVQPDVANAVARIVARIHAASAGKAQIAAQFRTRDTFYALRVEPYLVEAARQNPIVADSLERLAEQTLQTEIALVHGDLSPKNILVGPGGPLILDAETACYGDPAFDVAFCLNHLLLKSMARPQYVDGYLSCFASFCDAYLGLVSWEEPSTLEARVVRLLPALLLARVDGKSPVEYLDEPQQHFVREFAIDSIGKSLTQLGAFAATWKSKVTQGHPRSERPEAD